VTAELTVEVVRGVDFTTQQIFLDVFAALVKTNFYQSIEGVPKDEEKDEKGDTSKEYDGVYVPEAIRAEILIVLVPYYYVDNFAAEFPRCQN
jgi:hypothetical protein